MQSVIRPGDFVIDATCGNGQDTVFLAQLTGPQGTVMAFDIQAEAIRRTRQLLLEHQCLEQVMLIEDNHAHLEKYRPEKVKAAMFNLGYLPGGDHHIVTGSNDTIAALKTILERLAPGGAITIAGYPGYEAGQQELIEVSEYLSGLNQRIFEVINIRAINQRNNPPQILVCSRINGGI
ncbi:MAG: class I SAM-dependent methyltransferase [Syntrophomonadaceae bacterium]|jgi:tRNA A58 N-methylase Trm61